MRLVDLVSQETGKDLAEMMLLRHSTDSVEKVIACDASLEEWTSIHPTGTKYDFWATGKPRITLVVVIIRNQVLGVYRVVGIEAEGSLYTLASETLRRSYIVRGRNDEPARRFTMQEIASTATGATITGWEGKEISPVARSDGKLFWEIEVQLPFGAERLLDQAGDGDSVNGVAGYDPQPCDRREIVERQIRQRRGQQSFRNALRERYGSRCLITGCEVLAVLEAAHISPYRGVDDHHPENGLLLRADVHTLFDLDLLGIEPESLRIELHPEVVDEYGPFANVALGCDSDHRPSGKALRLRYEQFLRRLHGLA
ncbi:MAG: HNH endonuclease [Minisyncoccota bacterium]